MAVTKKEMHKIEEYHSKISEQLAQLFNEESENYINPKEFNEGDNLTLFVHALANTVPSNLYNNFTDSKIDTLGFNHIANRLCVQYKK